MPTHFVRDNQLKYSIYPGSELQRHWVFAFYGYGQNKDVFDPLAVEISGKFGLVVFDLPYVQQEETYSKEDFKKQMRDIIHKNGIQKISGISYSIGSRYNLILAEHFPDTIEKIFIIAPDGIKINFWNKFATATFAGKWLFKVLMHHPQVYLKILNLIYLCKLLPKTLYTFSKWHVRNYENSTMVYHTWMNMKEMIPDLKLIQENITQHSFQLTAFFGLHDRVIGRSCREVLRKKIPTAKVIELNKGHNVLDDNLFHHIASLL